MSGIEEIQKRTDQIVNSELQKLSPNYERLSKTVIIQVSIAQLECKILVSQFNLSQANKIY